MLFQMCYGPEIKSIYESISNNPGISMNELKDRFQYTEEGDTKSLITGVVTFLKDVSFVEQQDEDRLFTINKEWNTVDVFRNLKTISNTEESITLNAVFSLIYEKLFVKPDRLYVMNLHYYVNSYFKDTLVGREKINAWKRMMEYLGIGRRAYTGFYALPQLEFMSNLLTDIGPWEGPLQEFCENKVDRIIPCVTDEGNIYKGFLYGLIFLDSQGFIELSYKQDLPYKTYGPNFNINWIKTEGHNDTLFK